MNEESILNNIKELLLKEYRNKIINLDNKIMTFGKYKDKTVLWIYTNSIGYCTWCENKIIENTNINSQFERFIKYIKQKKIEEE